MDRFLNYLTIVDFFPITAKFRVSYKRVAQNTGIGSVMSIIIIVISTIYFIQRYVVLTERNSTSINSLTYSNQVNPTAFFNYTINKPDEATGWIPRVAFGIYDVNGFKEPEDLARIGSIKAYMYKM